VAKGIIKQTSEMEFLLFLAQTVNPEKSAFCYVFFLLSVASRRDQDCVSLFEGCVFRTLTTCRVVDFGVDSEERRNRAF